MRREAWRMLRALAEGWPGLLLMAFFFAWLFLGDGR